MVTLITGGSGSGKSAYAESVITGFGEHERIYIATMYPFDEESHERIRRHRKMREKKLPDAGMLYRLKKSPGSARLLCTAGMYVQPGGK